LAAPLPLAIVVVVVGAFADPADVVVVGAFAEFATVVVGDDAGDVLSEPTDAVEG
jgi:hypothetical protein